MELPKPELEERESEARTDKTKPLGLFSPPKPADKMPPRFTPLAYMEPLKVEEAHQESLGRLVGRRC